jgi:Uma2 family endonuclease
MMTAVSMHSELMTADELLGLPRGAWRYELIDGSLRRMTRAGHIHGIVAARIGARLLEFVESFSLGAVYAAETGFLLRHTPDTVRAPDAAFVSRDRLASMALLPAGYFPGAPDLAVEVLSPSDSVGEIRGKVADWLACGCAIVLVIDPDRRVAEVHRPGQVESFAAPAVVTLDLVLPGWSVDLSDLFR